MSKAIEIESYLNHQDATWGHAVVTPCCSAVLASRKGQFLAFILTGDGEAKPQALDMKRRIEAAEGQAFLVRDPLEVQAILQDLAEAERDTCIAFGCDDEDD